MRIVRAITEMRVRDSLGVIVRKCHVDLPREYGYPRSDMRGCLLLEEHFCWGGSFKATVDFGKYPGSEINVVRPCCMTQY